jgi:uncharacterized peroxidase-related enzyme
MSWTRAVSPAEAAGPLKDFYARIAQRAPHGEVSNLWQSLALVPPALEASFALVRALLDDPAPLTPAQAEMIAVVVSATSGCVYCATRHGLRLAKALGDAELAHAIALDYRAANLAARDRVLLDYAVALTCEPGERKLEDVERLREYGYDDPAIVRATAIAGCFAYASRLALALGIVLEPNLEPWEIGS